ncbi:MAG: hypothetical protein H0T79_12790 [Deltaproteobacteria bacterium]|nr:hypothetical protein [Deltaproteobacteria bacterium]
MANTETALKIDELRQNLNEKLGELHRRANHTKDVLTPSTYWKNPWVRVGIAAALGFVVGDLRRRPSERTYEGMTHAVLRAGLATAASALVARWMAASDRDA